jgi:Flp pilus assembly pilin Flp
MLSVSQASLASAAPSRYSPRLRILGAFFRDETGQDNIEFALLGSWISIVAILALQAIGPRIASLYLALKFALMNVRSSMPIS